MSLAVIAFSRRTSEYIVWYFNTLTEAQEFKARKALEFNYTEGDWTLMPILREVE